MKLTKLNLAEAIADPAYRANLEKRLWAGIEVRSEDECWPWTKAIRGGTGYGAISKFSAHRVSYALAYSDPGDLFVCHRCDNRKCCNPAHLFAGSQADNVRDMISKGRAGKPYRPHGTEHHSAKLNEADVRAIRADPRSLSKIAAQYGINQATASRIRRREIWSYLV